MPLIWESSSFGGTPIVYALPSTSSIYWSGSVDVSGSDLSHISLSYYEIGAPSSSVVLNQESLIVTWSQSNTLLPGFFSGIYELQGGDTGSPPPPINIDNSELDLSLSNIFYNFAYVSSSVIRRGLFLNESSGSPQLSFEPVVSSPTQVFPGDWWFHSASAFTDGAGGFRFADEDANGTTYINRLATARVTEPTYESSVTRMASQYAPRNMVVTANSFVANRWFVTVNSGSVSGAGWLNAHWSGGFYMPNSQSVSIYGTKDFWVPSGSLLVSGTTIFGGIEYKWPTSSPSINNVLTVDSIAGDIVNLKWDVGGGGGGSETASYAETASVAHFAESIGPPYTLTASVAVNPSYTVITSGSQHLPTGVYIVIIDANNGQHNSEIYNGQMAWYSGNTDSTGSDEIILHRMGEFIGSQSMYLRTRRRSGNVPGYLEMAASEPSPTASYYFTFVPLM